MRLTGTGVCAILLLQVFARSQTQAPKANSGVTPPHPTYTPNPEYPPEARRAKLHGICVLTLTVGADGKPHAVRMVHPLGSLLDEKTLQTFSTWRYEAARENGQPVDSEIKVEITFCVAGNCKQNDPSTYLQLSKDYLKGHGVPKDETFSLVLLTRAANWNVPEAQYLMGERFNQAIPPDTVTAYLWFALAKRSGYKKGEEMLKKLAPKMSVTQLNDAETRVDYWPESPPR